MAHISLTAGRLLCGKLRNYLDACKFKGMKIEYIESSGWFERTFTIKGGDKDVQEIHEKLNDWFIALGED